MASADEVTHVDGHDGGPLLHKPPSLAEHARIVLRDDILAGRLTPGARLTEALVTDRTGVSRTPVREAMRLLQAEGLVTAERGRGTYVAFRLNREEALLIYRCRLVIEPHMTRIAAERATSRTLRHCQELVDRFADELARGGDSRVISSIDAEFHSAIYEASHSELIAIFRSYWAKLQLQLSERVYDREAPARFLEEHVGILQALRERRGGLAARLMTDHIKHGQRRIAESFAAGRDA